MAEPAQHPAPTEDELALLEAAYGGDLAKVQSLVAGGTNVNVQSNEFYDMGMHRDVTPLMCAAAQGHLDIVRWLLEHGASVAAQTALRNSEGGPGTQALHFAAAGGYETIVAALLDAGADINAQGKFGRTPLTCALAEGKLLCAKLLLARGASVTIKSKHKEFKPPLVELALAASNTTSLVARNKKLVPQAKDLWDQKQTLLELIQSLLSAGADPNDPGKGGAPPLTYLAHQLPEDISLPIARLLIQSGANPDAVAKTGRSILLSAALYKSTAFARLLLEHPLDINRLSETGGTALDVIENNIKFAKRDIASAGDRESAEAELRDLESLRDLLISRGAKCKSELPAVAPAEKAQAEERHIASDFLKLLSTTDDAAWALLAVKAPFEAVADAYFKFAKSKSRQQDVPLRPAANGEEIPRVSAVIKVKNSPWTIILYTIFHLRSPDLKHVVAAAGELSKLLGTRAVTWCGTEDTDNGRCELFENGQRTATAGNAKSIALLTKEAVALPACYPARNGQKTWLAVEAASIAMVERADLIAR